MSFPPDSIYREIWKLPDLDNTQTVKVHVARMRHKMEAACPGHSFIGTVWKQGTVSCRKQLRVIVRGGEKP